MRQDEAEIRDIAKRAGLNETGGGDSWLSQYVDVQHVAKVTRMHLPPEAWQLYESQSGWKRVGGVLSNTFAKLVNKGLSREEVSKGMNHIMDKYSEFGASDTEPRYTLQDLLTLVFGPSDQDY